MRTLLVLWYRRLRLTLRHSYRFEASKKLHLGNQLRSVVPSRQRSLEYRNKRANFIFLSLLLLALVCSGHSTTSLADNRDYALENLRTGTRCGTADSVEVDIINTSSSNMRGYVSFGGDKVRHPTGLLKPGQRMNEYTCHGTASVSVVYNLGSDPGYPFSYGPKPDCPGYEKPFPIGARACRATEIPRVVEFYGKNLSCSWCY
jgi:hypothetical protein